jgi:DNA-binding response OmpR family regulator
MRVYLRCRPDREKLFRDILDTDFEVEVLSEDKFSQPTVDELVLADLTAKGKSWKENLTALRKVLNEGVVLIAVLHPEQIEDLERGDPLDDFIAEGSALGELRARLRRQVIEHKDEPGVLRYGELAINGEKYEVKVNERPVELTFKEFELLRYLASRPGKVFTREVLLEQVWGYDYYGGSRTVDVHIRRIRSKIEREGSAYIRTVRGVGYIFEYHPPE